MANPVERLTIDESIAIYTRTDNTRQRRGFLPALNGRSLDHEPVILAQSPQKRKEALAEKKRQLQLKRQAEQEARQLALLRRQVKDAETGETIHLTTAVWTPIEGRLEYTTQGLLDYGTKDSSLLCPEIQAKPSHELVQSMQKSGPIQKLFNAGWDAVTNTIVDPVQLKNRLPATQRLQMRNTEKQTRGKFSNRNDFMRITQERYQQILNSLPIITDFGGTAIDILGPSVEYENQPAKWEAMEKRFYKELHEMCCEIWKIRNGGTSVHDESLDKMCLELATLKATHVRQYAELVMKEFHLEEKRRSTEILHEVSPLALKRLVQLHDEERKRGCELICALKRDQDMIMISRMRESGLLW